MEKNFTWSEIEDDDHVSNYYAYYRGEELGFIEFWERWKEWVWNQGEDVIMSEDCLSEVIKKLKELKARDG